MRCERLIAIAVAMTGLTQPLWADDTVRYFASGWPIALVDAACGENERCQTELANCGPGTDGTCTTQIARFTQSRGRTVVMQSLCTVYIDTNGRDVVVRMPNGDTWAWWKSNPKNAEAVRNPIPNGPPICREGGLYDNCFSHIIDTPTLTRWANGQEGE